jgi:hypothetical protein
MSRCSVNRWGSGTTCERPVNTEASKELQERLSMMAQERAKQDKMWTQDSTTSATSVSATLTTATSTLTTATSATTSATTHTTHSSLRK